MAYDLEGQGLTPKEDTGVFGDLGLPEVVD